jgi:hypothetical protein
MKVFDSYRELLAEALSPKPLTRHADVVIVKEIQFKPSVNSLRRADEVRRRVRADMAQATVDKT